MPVFEKRAKRELIKSSKFYFFDCGVFQSIRPLGPLDNRYEIGGQALETLIAQHLRAWIDYSNKSGKLYFWRTKAGLELDFIIYGEIGFYGLQVKHTTNLNPKDFRALKEFKEDYPEASCVLLYNGKERIMNDKILCIPIQEFLFHLKPNMAII